MQPDTVQNHRYRFFAIAAMGTFIGTLEGSILNVALPTMASELSVAIDVIAWVVLAYQLTVVSLLMVFGAWAGRRGYPFAYKFGFTFLVVGSLICAVSQTIEPLLFGRVVQALGGAMFQAVGMGLITTAFPPEERGKGIGLMAMMVALGLMIGPPLGGLMLTVWPWQVIFYLSSAVAVVGTLMAYSFFRGFESSTSERKINLSSAAALSVCLLSGMLAMTVLDSRMKVEGPFGLLLALSLAALVVFLWRERRPASALIGGEVFRNTQFRISIIAMFLMFAALSGALILVPFYLQDIRGYEPRTVGLFLTILPLTMMVVAPLSGRISDKIGFKALTVGGLLIFAVGLYLLSELKADSSNQYLVIGLTTLGIGVGIFNSPNSSALMGSVKPHQRSIASSINSSTRNIGMAFGVAIATTLFEALAVGGGLPEAEQFVLKYRYVTYICLTFALAAALTSSFRKNRLEDAAPTDHSPVGQQMG